MRKIFFALIAIAALLCSSTAGAAPAKPRKGKTRTTATAKRSTAAQGIAATPAAICKYLDDTDFEAPTTTAILKKQIASARRLAPAVIKAFNAKNPSKSSLANPEKVLQYSDIVEDYAFDRHSNTTADMNYASYLCSKYNIFAAIYAYGCVADLITDNAARESYYEAVVAGENFIHPSCSFLATMKSIRALGGSMRSLEYSGCYRADYNIWVKMIVSQYYIIKGEEDDLMPQDLTSVWKEYDKACRKLLHDVKEEVKEYLNDEDDLYGLIAGSDINNGNEYLENAQNLALTALKAYQQCIARTKFADKAPLFESAASKMLITLAADAKIPDD